MIAFTSLALNAVVNRSSSVLISAASRALVSVNFGSPPFVLGPFEASLHPSKPKNTAPNVIARTSDIFFMILFQPQEPRVKKGRAVVLEKSEVTQPTGGG